jgi:hypothetical protein
MRTLRWRLCAFRDLWNLFATPPEYFEEKRQELEKLKKEQQAKADG